LRKINRRPPELCDPDYCPTRTADLSEVGNEIARWLFDVFDATKAG
jgi:hypothetical protein